MTVALPEGAITFDTSMEIHVSEWITGSVPSHAVYVLTVLNKQPSNSGKVIRRSQIMDLVRCVIVVVSGGRNQKSQNRSTTRDLLPDPTKYIVLHP